MTLAADLARRIHREVNDRALAMVGAIDAHCIEHAAPLTPTQEIALRSAPVYAFSDLGDWLEQILAGLRLDTETPFGPAVERVNAEDDAA